MEECGFGGFEMWFKEERVIHDVGLPNLERMENKIPSA